MNDPFATTAARQAGADAEVKMAPALKARANIFALSQAAEDAVLTPKDAGAFSHALRAALAARMARLNGDEATAAHYEGLADITPYAALATPAASAGSHRAVVAFVDKTAANPKDIDAADIATLQAEGVGDADIVRLCELIAFMAYQLRVIAGLRLLGGPAA